MSRSAPVVVQLRAPFAPAETERPAAVRGRRQALLSGPAALIAAVVLLIAVMAGGGGDVPPATGAAALVPADALAYVHVSTDASRPAVKQALTLAARFPDFGLVSAAVQSRIGAIAGGSGAVDFQHDILPWVGKEAALALLNTQTATAGLLIVLDVRDRNRAGAFLTRAGAAVAAGYRGTQILRYPSGNEAAFVSHYLALGQDASVRDAIGVLLNQPALTRVINDRDVAGVSIQQLSLAPGLEFDYAVAGGLVIVSTSLDAVTSVIEHARALQDDAAYRSAMPNRPQRVTSLLFLDFSQLLSFGEQTGLTRSARYRALRADLDKIRTVGLDSTSGEADSTAELFLQIP